MLLAITAHVTGHFVLTLSQGPAGGPWGVPYISCPLTSETQNLCDISGSSGALSFRDLVLFTLNIHVAGSYYTHTDADG